MSRIALSFPEYFPDPDWAGKTYRLEPPEAYSGEWRLGRAPGCDICLKVRTISRNHAAIQYSYMSNGWSIQDLGSSGGTTLNRQALVPGDWHPINIGDKFWLGTPENRIAVVLAEEDTLNFNFPAGPPPAEASSAKTSADALYALAEWFTSGETPAGKVYRLAVLIVAAGSIAAIIILLGGASGSIPLVGE